MSTILAVDDSATMRKCLEITFEGTEFSVVTCDSASAALEQVKTLGPDLVISDVALASSDGYELCSTIKLAAPNLPILMLSSKQNPFDPSRGAQADDHIDKPFDTQVMQDKARGLVNAAPRSDTDIPGAPRVERPPAAAAASQKPVATPPSSKIPAPRRKRPTPAMMSATPHPPQAKPAAQPAAGRRTVPFAMPSGLKKGAQQGGVNRTAAPDRGSPDRTMPMPGKAEQAASAQLGRSATPRPVTTPSAQPNKAPMQDTMPGAQSTAQPVAASGAAAQIPAAAAADLQTKLQALGLTAQQMEGVLSLSREVLEQVVWDVVPTLAETLIKEEIARLTKE